MSIFNFLRSEQDKKVIALKEALQESSKQTRYAPTLLKLTDQGVEKETINRLLDKKKLDIRIREKASFLQQLVKAKNDLDNGQPELAADLIQAGHDQRYFDHLTGGEPTLAKMQAKEKVAEGDPHFSNNINFALNQQHQAIVGYSELGMEAECERAMRSYLDLDLHTNSSKKRLREYMAGPISPLSLAAIRVSQDLNMLTAEDHLNLIKKHPDDEQRVRSIDFVTKDFAQRRKAPGRYKEIDADVFSTLLNHVKTDEVDGHEKVSKSQIKAIELLNADRDLAAYREFFQHSKEQEIAELQEIIGHDIKEINVKEHLAPNLSDEYFSTVISETRKANPAILNTVFGSPAAAQTFLWSYMHQEHRAHNNTQITQFEAMDDILPPTLQGENAAKARNHIAEQFKQNCIMSYTQDPNPRPVVAARLASRLAGDVLMDDSLPENSAQKVKTESLLNSLKEVENFAINQGKKYTEQLNGQWATHSSYNENKGFGVAQAMMETAEIVKKRNAVSTFVSAPTLNT